MKRRFKSIRFFLVLSLLQITTLNITAQNANPQTLMAMKTKDADELVDGKLTMVLEKVNDSKSTNFNIQEIDSLVQAISKLKYKNSFNKDFALTPNSIDTIQSMYLSKNREYQATAYNIYDELTTNDTTSFKRLSTTLRKAESILDNYYKEWATTASDTVQVIVKVKDTLNNELPNYEVYYSLYDNSEKMPFPDETNNAKKKMVAGRTYFYIKKGPYLTSKFQDIEADDPATWTVSFYVK